MHVTQNLPRSPAVSEGSCEALFASELQPSDSPTVRTVAEAGKPALHRRGLHPRLPPKDPRHDRRDPARRIGTVGTSLGAC
jgi:hypothetical protein